MKQFLAWPQRHGDTKDIKSSCPKMLPDLDYHACDQVGQAGMPVATGRGTICRSRLSRLGHGRFGFLGRFEIFGMIGIIFLPQESAGSKIDWDTRTEKYREQVVLLVPARRWKCIWKGEFAAKGYLLPNEANKSYRINKSVAWRCKKGCLMRLNQF